MSWIVGASIGAITGIFSAVVLKLDPRQLRWWLVLALVISASIIGFVHGMHA